MKKWLPTIIFWSMVLTLIALFGLMLTFAPENHTSKNETQTEEENTDTEQSTEDSNQESENRESEEEKEAEENGSEQANSEQEEETSEEESTVDTNEEKQEGKEEGKEEESSQEYYWGVDSASYTDDNLYACVNENFGKPEIWGRYLGDNEGVSAGIDANEIEYHHNEDIQILLIYNHVTDVRGYDNGVSHANEAITLAEEFEVPEGVALFVDIEPEYPVDAAFMEGWFDTLQESIYEPAIYGVFDEGSALSESFLALDEELQENIIIWTAYPQEEITSKDNAPEYNPAGPENAKIYGWQYAIDAETCNIDTNLFTDEMLDFLW